MSFIFLYTTRNTYVKTLAPCRQLLIGALSLSLSGTQVIHTLSLSKRRQLARRPRNCNLVNGETRGFPLSPHGVNASIMSAVILQISALCERRARREQRSEEEEEAAFSLGIENEPRAYRNALNGGETS